MGKSKRRSKSRSEPVVSSSKRSKKSKTTITIKKKRKNWSVDLDKRFKIMKGAVEDVIEKKMTIRKAAEKWGVKRSTLADRVSGRVELGRRSGPPSILSRAEEQMLTEWIISMAQRGYGFKKQKLLKTVKKILDKDKRTTMLKKNMPGNKWYRQFVKRNPRVKMVTSNPQLLGTRLDKATASASIEYEAFHSMLSSYEMSDSESEGDSDSDSEVESESGSEVEEELQLQSPGQIDYNTEVIVETEFEPQLEPDLESELKPDLKSDQEPQPDVVVDSSNLEDFKVDHSPSPDISVANTVTITTSE
ncbi:uncharacterized protein LOC110975677 [Acanthaster planci]|uniref:Uncharacterized protein LOC110975677 n=1 Tax=Acanthaster planci TaxID=133434 RepID=A0A8B7XT66_ACAPL|nr:uncharacterized protein LOC110975677 [Acanthaster planci]